MTMNTDKHNNMLLDLPSEIFLAVVDFVTNSRDLAAMAAANREFYQLINPKLYSLMVRTMQARRVLLWGAATGNIDTIRMCLEAGADPSCYCPPSNLLRSDQPPEPRQCRCRSDPQWLDDELWAEDSIPLSQRGFLRSYGYTVCDAYPVDCTDEEHNTIQRAWMPIHVAAFYGHCDVLKLLLQHAKETSHTTQGGEGGGGGGDPPVVDQPLICHSEWFTYLYTECSGARLIYRCRNIVSSPLLFAITCGRSDAAIYLLSQGASVDWRNPEFIYDSGGPTALHIACQRGLVDVIAAIVEGGYQDVEVKDESGQTPLLVAMSHRKWDCVRWLMGHGASVHTTIETRSGATYTPLMRAIVRRREDIETIREMLHQQPFDDQKRISSGELPLRQTLIAAARVGNIGALEAILASSGPVLKVVRENAQDMLWALLDLMREDPSGNFNHQLYLGSFLTVKHVDEAIDTMSLLVDQHKATWSARVPAKKFMDRGKGGQTALEKLKRLMTYEYPNDQIFNEEMRCGIALCLESRISIEGPPGRSIVTILTRGSRKPGGESLDESACLYKTGDAEFSRLCALSDEECN